MGESRVSVRTREKTPDPHHSDNWSKKTAFLIWTLLTTNLFLLIMVVRLKVTYRERHTEHREEHFTNRSPLDETTERCRLCPHLWLQIKEKCYFFAENKKTRDESQKNCSQMGAQLATINNGVLPRLVSFMNQEFWVGLSPSGSHYQGESWTGVRSDNSTVAIQNGAGTCAKLGLRLMLENCYKELCWICEKDV
ncbi:C-type lectin domain family 2 member B-like isoform X2 [Phyllobates terribilis]|uniref:C-type lectin domain family 2 member B-like isoform X2 n=1 Tax=Phyllobates terribilis TaxID=111132 RepID=UPI003CCAA025